LDDVRNSTAARLTVNMWTMNFFAEANNPGTLILSIDMHFILPEGKKIINA
jgi:hypothetical protein